MRIDSCLEGFVKHGVLLKREMPVMIQEKPFFLGCLYLLPSSHQLYLLPSHTYPGSRYNHRRLSSALLHCVALTPALPPDNICSTGCFDLWLVRTLCQEA